jgi:membrane-associated phospholipid phosphatase
MSNNFQKPVNHNSVSYKVAKSISKWGNPLVYSPIIFFLGSVSQGKSISYSIILALITTLLIDAPVFTVIVIGLRKGRYSHLDIPDREKRNEIYALSTLSTAFALVCLFYLQAPSNLLATVLALLISTFLGALINRFWKISIHTGSIAGSATILSIIFWPQAIWAFILVPIVGWSRFVLGEHTPPQIILGAIFTTIITILTFSFF